MLKCRFIKFMVANVLGKNKHVAYVANLCFRNAMPSSGRNINKTMSGLVTGHACGCTPTNATAVGDHRMKVSPSENVHPDWLSQEQ